VVADGVAQWKHVDEHEDKGSAEEVDGVARWRHSDEHEVAVLDYHK